MSDQYSQHDWDDDPDAKAWIEDVRRDLIPKLTESAVVCSLVPEGEPDVKYAVELGMSILLDKPIIAVFQPGTQVPERLVRVADEMIEIDLSQPGSNEKLAERLNRFMTEYGAEEEAEDAPGDQ